MSLSLLVRWLACLALFSYMLFLYLERNNELTELRLELPDLEEKLRVVCERNVRLEYEIERLEGPERLMELAQQPEYQHLHYPSVEEVWVMSEAVPNHE